VPKDNFLRAQEFGALAGDVPDRDILWDMDETEHHSARVNVILSNDVDESVYE
jgi:hypothetical protein